MDNWVVMIGPEEEENLSLRYLAASLEGAGYRTAILPFNSGEALASVAAAVLNAPNPPTLIALSLAFQWRAKDFLALAMGLREGGYRGHITAGGHFATFAARALLDDFTELDSICLHEAEDTLVELARALTNGSPIDRIEGLATRVEGRATLTTLRTPRDLAGLPWPDRRGDPSSCLGHAMAPLIASRGCYANCAFCCIAAWHRLAGGPRFRMRPVDDVAEEMAWLHRERQIDIFIFHDDNFFLPGHRQSLQRIRALADALEARHLDEIAIVVKARPTDVSPAVFTELRDRLRCIRVFLGIENASEQGLATLDRQVHAEQNHDAMRLLRELGIYVCFNMLIFEPDATLDGLQANLGFMEQQCDYPCNFGRVELYAGTPLLARMQAEKRCWGDYFGHDYRLGSPEVQQVFELAMQCFQPRNFAPFALANRLQTTRFDVEVARRFHGDLWRPDWLVRAQDLSTRLTRDSVSALREIMRFVTGGRRHAEEFTSDLSARLRATEQSIGDEAGQLEATIQSTVGRQCRHGRPARIALVGS